MNCEQRSVDSLVPYARNSRTHSDEQVAAIAGSIREFGFTNPVLIDHEGGIIAGHGRVMAARKLGMAEVPCIVLAHLTEIQKRAYVIADNKLALNAGWDEQMLALELQDLTDADFDVSLTGFEVEELADILGQDVEMEGRTAGSLADRFLIAPFSVLNAREGWWQERKDNWLAMGIRSEVGRDDNLAFSASSQPPHVYAAKNAYEAKVGRTVTWEEFTTANPGALSQQGTSIFDPVVCEIAYRWFCPPGGTVLDPFAGGSVRGVVAAKLGRQYVGCDLRQEQVSANREQWSDLGSEDEPAPVWVCGDSQHIDQLAQGVEADFVFSCPPYADLEVYSKDKRDLSTMRYADFLKAYREIIRKSVAMLKPDRFACFVVGEVRDSKGIYRNFVGDTVAAFTDAGARFYNEAILVTSVGSLAIRAGKGFSTSRKLGKTHQNVLIFVKGDPRKATEACGAVELDESLFAEATDERQAA